MIKTNICQTPLTEETIKVLSREDRAEFYNVLDNVVFIQNLISPNRGYTKDLPKDEFNRIAVNITSPHILEDTNYFRGAALHFERFGVYTNLPPNAHPMSEYYKFWKEEARRCREGYIREEDGEWIPGDYYYYLNYSPILLSKASAKHGIITRVEGFPKFWDGSYLYYHYMEQARQIGQHTNCLKCRGRGYSFEGASLLGKVFILGDRDEESREKQAAFAIANEKEFLIKDGLLNKFTDNINWCAEHTPWPRNRLKDSLDGMVWTMGFKDKTTQRIEGTQNEVVGISLKNDPQKARGKRGCRVQWEEFGKFPHVLTAWQVARPSVEDGGVAFGQMNGYGTGGTTGADFTAAEEMFYNPVGYNIMELPNVYDLNTDGTSKCSFFHGEYLNRNLCYDKNGNSDVVKALLEVFVKRAKIKSGTSDPNAIVQEKAESPIFPQEAVMRREGSIFPVLDLKEHLAEISVDVSKFVAPHYVGDLYFTGEGTVLWRRNDDKIPIRDFPIKDKFNKQGAVEIFQHPIKNHEGRIPWLRYIMGVDPIDDDYSTTDSLGSAFVFDRFNDQIVAEYTGRQNTANEFYDIVYRLSRYYNALINYENDKKGLFTYFTHNHALQYLADTPQILRDMEYIKDPASYGNKSKGTNSSKNINAWGRRLQADWMRAVATGELSTSVSEDGTEVERVPLRNAQKIRSIGYLKEAVAWNADSNFDRIAAMGMCMILREELTKFEATESIRIVKTKSKDDFFKRMDTYTKDHNSYSRIIY